MTEQLTEQRPELATGRAVDGPIRVSWAPVPKVNLLPIEIVEKRRFRRTQLVLGVAVLSSALVAGGGTYWAQQGINHANDDLSTSQSQVSALTAEQGKYAAVPRAIAQVEAANAARTLAMGNDVLWSRYLNDVYAARPAGVELSSVTLTLNANTVATTAGNPLTLTGIGVAAFAGTADQYQEVSDWLEALNKITGFASSSLTNAGKVGATVTFTSGAIINSDALSGRYVKKAG